MASTTSYIHEQNCVLVPLDRSRGGVFLHRKDIDPARAPFLLNCHLGEDIEMSWLFVDEFPKRCVHV